LQLLVMTQMHHASENFVRLNAVRIWLVNDPEPLRVTADVWQRS
jgi:hypothetical protein